MPSDVFTCPFSSIPCPAFVEWAEGDMWCIGCLFYFMYTGSLLFNTQENEYHLAMMEKVPTLPVGIHTGSLGLSPSNCSSIASLSNDASNLRSGFLSPVRRPLAPSRTP